MKALETFSSSVKRHLEAIRFVTTLILPAILRTGRRPVIFSKYSGIGDIICTFPAALELKKRHPGAEFIYNCHPDYVCLPKIAGVATHVTSNPNIGLIEYWYRFLLSGFYHFISDDDRSEVVPSEVYIKDFAKPFGVTVTDDHPRLQSAPSVLAKVRGLLQEEGISKGPLIVIHPGPSWPVREWPDESWSRLVEELRRRGFPNIVQLGTGKVLRFGAVDVASIPGVLPLIDKLTLEESIALISLGSLFVGIDSGLLHIAASVQTPAVGLWGPTSPQLRFSAANARSFVTSGVECQGCHHRVPRLHWITGCPFEIACMKSIPVEEVLKACLSRLESRPATLQS